MKKFINLLLLTFMFILPTMAQKLNTWETYDNDTYMLKTSGCRHIYDMFSETMVVPTYTIYLYKSEKNVIGIQSSIPFGIWSDYKKHIYLYGQLELRNNATNMLIVKKGCVFQADNSIDSTAKDFIILKDIDIEDKIKDFYRYFGYNYTMTLTIYYNTSVTDFIDIISFNMFN